MSITTDLDLRSSLGVARDQGQRNTCIVFAATSAHEASRGMGQTLSPEFLYYHGAQRSHQDPDKGLALGPLGEALKEDGQPVEQAWPYRLQPPALTSWKPPSSAKPVYKATLKASQRTLTEVRDLLQQGTPVMIMMTITTAMHSPDPLAIVRQTLGERPAGRHAVLAVGSGHDDQSHYLLVRNSWGTHWGQRGHGWLHDDYVTTHMTTTAVVSPILKKHDK